MVRFIVLIIVVALAYVSNSLGVALQDKNIANKSSVNVEVTGTLKRSGKLLVNWDKAANGAETGVSILAPGTREAYKGGNERIPIGVLWRLYLGDISNCEMLAVELEGKRVIAMGELTFVDDRVAMGPQMGAFQPRLKYIVRVKSLVLARE